MKFFHVNLYFIIFFNYHMKVIQKILYFPQVVAYFIYSMFNNKVSVENKGQ